MLTLPQVPPSLAHNGSTYGTLIENRKVRSVSAKADLRWQDYIDLGDQATRW